MKNILIPTDFSDNAGKALDVALALANKFGATLHMLHAYHSTSHAGHLSNVNRVIKADREKEMEEFLEKTKASIDFDLEIKGYCKKGYPVELIEQLVDKADIDLTIMGTLGASNIGKKMMGSTTSNLIKNGSTPVLAIPTNIVYTDLDTLVVALDAMSMKAPATLDPMVKLAQKLGLKIELVHVSDGKIHTDIDPAIKDYLNQFDVPFAYSKVQSEHILEGILNFARDKGNALLCMVSHQRNWFENLFHSSVSQKIALQSELPLLVLHDDVA